MRTRRSVGESAAAVRNGRAEPPRPRRDPGDVLKVPMPDQVNELVILAAALVDHEARRRLTSTIPPDSFFAPGHPEAWRVVVELERRGLAYDPATVRQLSGGKVDAAYLDGLVRDRPAAPPNLQHHVDQLRWDRARVEGIRGPVQGFLDALRDPLAEPEKVRAFARQVAGAFDGFGSQKYLRDPSALVRSAVAKLEAKLSGEPCSGYGIPGIDMYGPEDPEPGMWRVIPGCAPEQMTVITGIPGSAKTTIVSEIALAQANKGRKVLFGAWEQGSEATLTLVASQSLGYSRTALQTGRFGQEHVQVLRAEMERLGEYIRFVELPFGRKRGEKQVNDRSLDLMHEMISVSGCQVAIFDLFRRALGSFDPDDEEAALYRQQAIAQETGAHCILLHQLNKEALGRGDPRPTLNSLKGSAAWYEVPDTLLGIYRPFLHKDVPDTSMQIIFLKQRHGIAPLAVEFDWDGDQGWASNGRSVVYERAGQQGMGADGIDLFLQGGASSGAGGGGNGGGKGKGRGKRGK